MNGSVDSCIDAPGQGHRLDPLLGPIILLSLKDTTRPRKSHEREGVEYHFVSKQAFEADIQHNKCVASGASGPPADRVSVPVQHCIHICATIVPILDPMGHGRASGKDRGRRKWERGHIGCALF